MLRRRKLVKLASCQQKSLTMPGWHWIRADAELHGPSQRPDPLAKVMR